MKKEIKNLLYNSMLKVDYLPNLKFKDYFNNVALFKYKSLYNYFTFFFHIVKGQSVKLNKFNRNSKVFLNLFNLDILKICDFNKNFIYINNNSSYYYNIKNFLILNFLYHIKKFFILWLNIFDDTLLLHLDGVNLFKCNMKILSYFNFNLLELKLKTKNVVQKFNKFLIKKRKTTNLYKSYLKYLNKIFFYGFNINYILNKSSIIKFNNKFDYNYVLSYLNIIPIKNKTRKIYIINNFLKKQYFFRVNLMNYKLKYKLYLLKKYYFFYFFIIRTVIRIFYNFKFLLLKKEMDFNFYCLLQYFSLYNFYKKWLKVKYYKRFYNKIYRLYINFIVRTRFYNIQLVNNKYKLKFFLSKFLKYLKLNSFKLKKKALRYFAYILYKKKNKDVKRFKCNLIIFRRFLKKNYKKVSYNKINNKKVSYNKISNKKVSYNKINNKKVVYNNINKSFKLNKFIEANNLNKFKSFRKYKKHSEILELYKRYKKLNTNMFNYRYKRKKKKKTHVYKRL